ncbi:MAG: hypothetical protein ACRDXX_22115 [Stackebrandtia sp.]
MRRDDYERLLGELTRRRRVHAVEMAETAHHDEEADKLADMENRLLSQQADLLNTARGLRLPPPKLRPADAETNAAASGDGDFEAALRQASRQADVSEAAAQRAWDRAKLPIFLPGKRPRIRHLAVYGLCALGGAAVQLTALVAEGMPDAAVTVAFAPVAAFVVGYFTIGHVRRPRLKPQRRRRGDRAPRDVKLGLATCLVTGLVVVTWWLTR